MSQPKTPIELAADEFFSAVEFKNGNFAMGDVFAAVLGDASYALERAFDVYAREMSKSGQPIPGVVPRPATDYRKQLWLDAYGHTHNWLVANDTVREFDKFFGEPAK